MAPDWSAYFQATLDKPLHPIWEHIDPLLHAGQVALDLGCGSGVATAHLVERGLKVLAVDQEPEALEITRRRLPADAEVQLVKAQFQDIGLEPESFDLVFAGFSLFFLREWEFGQVWKRIVAALKPKGIFAGQLLGVHDDWADRGYTVLTADEARALFTGFEIEHFEEAERDGETSLREPKHWHVFHIVARKPGL
jgi:tellurite methyltransferase